MLSLRPPDRSPGGSNLMPQMTKTKVEIAPYPKTAQPRRSQPLHWSLQRRPIVFRCQPEAEKATRAFPEPLTDLYCYLGISSGIEIEAGRCEPSRATTA